MSTPFDWLTLGLGTTGTVLGILTGLQQLRSSRVRLLVKCYPLCVREADDRFEEYLCVEVVNRGSFPVTIKKAEFELEGPRRGLFFDTNAKCVNGKRLPCRIESHDSIMICFPNLPLYLRQLQIYKRAVVETACCQIRYGSLEILRKASEREMKKAPNEEQPTVI